MDITPGFFRTNTLDPWWNLAIEEYLLDNIKKDQCILYLWQNQNTVVIGRNQNPWKECRTELLENEGGKLARRLSGGGAVFHDTGNLNFTFVMGREAYDLDRQLSVILGAVNRLGIAAVKSGRNDLAADERKFSGNAFCFRRNGAYHHGTILVSADMDKLTRYLQVSPEKIRSKGVESVRSRVVNLSEFKPGLTIEETAHAVEEVFSEIYGKPRHISEDELKDRSALLSLYEKYSSWEWRYGEAPQFDIDMSARFAWGGVEMGIQLENGIISKARVFSDAMDADFFEQLGSALRGRKFHSGDMSRAVRDSINCDEQKVIAEDIALWIEQKGF